MKLRANSPRWFDDENPERQAKCVLFPATSNYDPWYPEDMDTKDQKDSEAYEDAKAICTGLYDGKPCPLLEKCLEFALVNNERFGIWGGTTAEERIELRKKNKWQRSIKAGERSSQAG